MLFRLVNYGKINFIFVVPKRLERNYANDKKRVKNVSGLPDGVIKCDQKCYVTIYQIYKNVCSIQVELASIRCRGIAST